MTKSRVFANVVWLVTGVFYAVTGALLFFSPYFFWSRIGPFGPFNAHYARDVGSFLLPLGIWLMVAVKDPARFRGVVALAAVGSVLHAISHLLDGIKGTGELITDVVLVSGAVLMLATLAAQGKTQQ